MRPCPRWKNIFTRLMIWGDCCYYTEGRWSPFPPWPGISISDVCRCGHDGQLWIWDASICWSAQTRFTVLFGVIILNRGIRMTGQSFNGKSLTIWEVPKADPTMGLVFNHLRGMICADYERTPNLSQGIAPVLNVAFRVMEVWKTAISHGSGHLSRGSITILDIRHSRIFNCI